MFEYTGVDGIMIGRGTFGNPWIFKIIKHFLETGEKLPQDIHHIQDTVFKDHCWRKAPGNTQGPDLFQSPTFRQWEQSQENINQNAFQMSGEVL